MSRWWRAYDEAVDDPKLILLTDKQHRAWFNLCCITSRNGGTLPALQVIAVKLRMSSGKAKDMVAQLAALGLIDHDAAGIFAPHNWNGRQYKSDVTDPTNAQRQKRYRNGRKTVTPTVTVTPPRDRVQNTDTEAIASAADAAPAEPVDEDSKAKLYRVGKTILVSFGIAEKRTGSLIGQWLKSRNDAVGLLAAIQYARDQNVAEPVTYISTVVNGKANGNQPQSLADRAFELAELARSAERARGIG